MKSNLHQRTLQAAREHRCCEANLILILQEHEETQEFRKMNFKSLHAYCVEALELCDSTASVFVAVARKAMKVPSLQSAIQERRLTVSKARKIAPVINLQNQEKWVHKARTLSIRKLEVEIVKINPREAVKEAIKAVSKGRLELKVGISQKLEVNLRRAQDLECQRTASAVSLEETLEAALEAYLEKKDPVRKAKRAKERAAKNDAPASDSLGNVRSAGTTIPAANLHEVHIRDEGRCTHIDEGKRCEQERWLQIHHIHHRADGGDHSTENLRTLCWAHHQIEHAS